MTDRHDVAATLRWMRDGEARFGALLAAVPDAALAEPCALPGWTRAHLVGHMARNAEALTRLATWARTGVETPMYSGPDQRNDDIEASAGHPPARLRADVTATATALDVALGAVGAAGAWTAQVRSAQGRDIPAAEVPWMRNREVWLHAVDLDAGASVDDIPAGVVDLLIADVAGVLSGKDGCPSAVLAPTDRSGTWTLGPAAGAAPTIDAPAAAIAGWLTGRSALDGTPALPRWL
ncbi:maleylpyruvate isomerase family mycothiol-dependent enzyme [Pseudonocardia sp. N23]|uniref:maleylpyruvate isomerase family mycothiol-dependent enzyme n=1 Tax=Pseudonocardia sp. N23 TaxID=1987376 RepID=UPI000BFBD8C2|nr:maleylpyruvate isomerase family mycothiol-dependent enzyme [Pseudonocardia sp. N23]